MPSKKHKVLITNPLPSEGQPDVVIKGIVAKGYIIVPIEASLFEVYMGKKYLGEAETMSQVKKLIKRDGADAPVLIQNPNGGYEMFSYNRPSSNPKKRKAKKAKKRTKKKTSVRKKKRISGAKKKVKKAKKKVKSAKKKVSKAKKSVRKAKGALSKAKRSKNPTPNPHKRKRKKSAKKAAAPRRPATAGDVNAYVKRITGKKF